jgi:hypothetical protein
MYNDTNNSINISLITLTTDGGAQTLFHELTHSLAMIFYHTDLASDDFREKLDAIRNCLTPVPLQSANKTILSAN